LKVKERPSSRKWNSLMFRLIHLSVPQKWRWINAESPAPYIDTNKYLNSLTFSFRYYYIRPWSIYFRILQILGALRLKNDIVFSCYSSKYMCNTYRDTYSVCRFVNASNISLGNEEIWLLDRDLSNKDKLMNSKSLTPHSIQLLPQ
jgi:hypothetical protein